MKLLRMGIWLYKRRYTIVLWIHTVKLAWKNKHIHFYKIQWKDGVNVYKECRCGSRKVEYSGIGYQPIDVEWLSGLK